ncbi:hypothetical protein BDZ85DRAFT_12079 [Elsinoe ampelina]|uniref:RING-type domain-containing protein n=1 Tax=Elsinoe ampelina TaxID=302913 RepID=A0A6A6GQT0_9PEZI|nr:hypothetical protein BDZ85DRAFT_12079 [Elsinoe ampelina]
MAVPKALNAKSQREMHDEIAPFLKPEAIPAKLRCATCSQLNLNASKLPCCDQSICETCSQNLPETCPVCTHSPFDRTLLSPHKALRMTVTAFLRAEIKKRAPKAEPAKQKEEIKLSAEPEKPATTVEMVEPVQADPSVDSSREADGKVDQELHPAVTTPMDAVISIEAAEPGVEVTEGVVSNQDEHAHEEAGEQVPGDANNEGDNAGEVDQTSSNMNQMQMGMQGSGFGGFNNMMAGMPNMAMGMPNMFGGFGGLGMGNMNAMNMSMMNGYGWNGQQAYAGNYGYYPNDGYNQSFGNGMQQYHNQGNYNRFQGQGSFRGRGRGFRGRGRFNQNYQEFHNQQGWNGDGTNGAFHGGGQQDYPNQAEDEAPTTANEHYSAKDAGGVEHETNGVTEHDMGTNYQLPDDPQPDTTNTKGIHDLLSATSDPTLVREESQKMDKPAPVIPTPEPPLNAPTGPKAMREPRPRRASHAPFVHEERRPSIAQSEQQSHTSHDDYREEKHSRHSSRDRHSKRDRSRSPRRDEESDEYTRDRKRRRDEREERYADDRHRSSKSSRHGRDRSRSPARDESGHGSRHGREKDRSSRDHREERESGRSKYDRKERSSKHGNRHDRRDDRDSDRDRRRHEREDDRPSKDSSRSRRREYEYEDKSSRRSERSGRGENLHPDDHDDVESSDKHSNGDRRRSNQTGSRDLGSRIEAGRRVRHEKDERRPSVNDRPAPITPVDDGIGFRIKGRGSVDVTSKTISKTDTAESPTAARPEARRKEKMNGAKGAVERGAEPEQSEPATDVDPYAAEREARQKERMAKEMKRRESATLGKRGRDEFDPPTGPKAEVRKRGRGSYHDDYEEDDSRREGKNRHSGRWR